VLAGLALLLAWLVWRGLTEGVHYRWQWAEAMGWMFSVPEGGGLPYMLRALLATLQLSLGGLAVALCLGLLLVVARLSSWSMPSNAAWLWVQFIRNMPALVFIFIFYFFISRLLFAGAGAGSLLAGMLCVGVVSSAYMAEVFRAGIEGVSKGQLEAARALGLGAIDRWRFVVLPQAFRRILPALTGQMVSLVKDSSIVSVISIQELSFAGMELASSSHRVYEVWLVVALAYFLLCSLVSRFMHEIEGRLKPRGY
jgi:polar amino acid transport system permease protein